MSTKQDPAQQPARAHREDEAAKRQPAPSPDLNLFEFLPIACLRLTRIDTIEQINPAAAALLGAACEEMLHRHFERFVLAADRDRWHHYLAGLSLNAGGDCELRLQLGDGLSFFARVAGVVVESAEGLCVRYLTLTNISAQKKLEEMLVERSTEVGTQAQALAEAEHFARATLDALPSRLCVLDEQGRIISANRAWQEFTAEPAHASHQRQRNSTDSQTPVAVMPCCSDAAAHLIDRAIKDLLAGKRQRFSLEYECPAHTPFRWFETHITRLPGDGPVRLVMTHDEITERKNAEEAQRKGAERLKQVGAHLESIREEQSALIARELHDELGALLTMLKLELATTAGQVAKSAPVRARFNRLLDRAGEALQVVKRISTNLRPATLDTLGLMATIRWYVDQFSRSSGIATELHLPDYVRLSDLAGIAVFRIIQESLTNVAAHSGANKVTIRVHKQTGELIVEIIDNGSGIAESDLQRLDSFGIIGMRERADYLGGNLAIAGQPQKGTQLTLRIPLDS